MSDILHYLSNESVSHNLHVCSSFAHLTFMFVFLNFEVFCLHH